MSRTVADALARVPMFRRLSAGDRAQLAAVSQLASHRRGMAIFQEGDLPRHLYVVAAGMVKICKSTPDGREVILELMREGDPLGAVAVYEDMPYPATARTIVASETIATPRHAFFELLGGNPSLVRGLLSGLTLRLVELTNRLGEVSGARVEARLARLFLRLAKEAANGASDFVSPRLSRQEVADLCGTTVETTIRVMSRWEKAHVLATERDGFRLLAPEALEDIAQIAREREGAP